MRNGDSYGGNIKLRLLANIVRRLKLKIRKQPELEGPKVLLADETIDNLLARELENQSGLEELLDSVIQDRVEEIQELNESLRGRN